MKLTDLLGGGAPSRSSGPAGDPEIVGLTADSRSVAAGFLFAALSGARSDGRRFAAEAVRRGAAAILTDDAAALDLPPQAGSDVAGSGVAIVTDANPRRRLALLAARFYTRQPRIVAAVTGTNGKTSVVHFVREIWNAAGCPAASLGTLGLVAPGGRQPGELTTPDPVLLHRDLAGLAAAGVEHLAIEASSHGLAQFRLDGLRVAAAAFTNLTRDHLDYHQNMAGYRAAKERLFTALLPPGKPAILNRDSPEYSNLARLCGNRGHRVLGYGMSSAAELRLVAARPRPHGQDIVLQLFGDRYETFLPLLGVFQATNALAALGLAIVTGVSREAAVAALPRLNGVPGRMQFVAHGEDGRGVLIDYAHTPDALANVLAALRPHARGRLVVLFGCGGDRDRGKRPLMGGIAAGAADRVYVTDDNPRSEDPALIRRAIISAAPQAVEIDDRRAAIATAIAELGPGDLLVIAGKGHETGQIVGDRILPFDDAEIARCAAQRLGLVAEAGA